METSAKILLLLLFFGIFKSRAMPANKKLSSEKSVSYSSYPAGGTYTPYFTNFEGYPDYPSYFNSYYPNILSGYDGYSPSYGCNAWPIYNVYVYVMKSSSDDGKSEETTVPSSSTTTSTQTITDVELSSENASSTDKTITGVVPLENSGESENMSMSSEIDSVTEGSGAMEM